MPIWHLKARQLFKCLPCAFTEQNVAVLSSVLRTFGRNLPEGEAMEGMLSSVQKRLDRRLYSGWKNRLGCVRMFHFCT